MLNSTKRGNMATLQSTFLNDPSTLDARSYFVSFSPQVELFSRRPLKEMIGTFPQDLLVHSIVRDRIASFPQLDMEELRKKITALPAESLTLENVNSAIVNTANLTAGTPPSRTNISAQLSVTLNSTDEKAYALFLPVCSFTSKLMSGLMSWRNTEI